MVDITYEIKFRPKKMDNAVLYHILPVEYKSFLVTVRALRMSDYNEVAMEEVASIPANIWDGIANKKGLQ